MAEELQGTIERVTFHNADTGFTVLRVQTPRRRELVTVIGSLASATAGEYVEAQGQWRHDPEHGLQFKADRIKTTPPHSTEGIAKYLGSGLVKGIGPHFAQKIVDTFGERTLAVIDESPSFLREVKGIGSQRIQRIREGWREQKAVRAIMMFLQGHEVGTSRAVRIYKTYGEQAIEQVRANPYRLATDIWGIGFQTADKLAARLGIDPTSPLRAQAALRYMLQRLSDEGHTGFPKAQVVERTTELTGIETGIIERALDEGCAAGELVLDRNAEKGLLFLKPLYLAEVGTTRAFRALQLGAHPLGHIDVEAAFRWLENRLGLALAPAQRSAVAKAATEKVLIVTGGPGVGKTTIVRGILEIFMAKAKRCALCAPTGRAAKRLAETTGYQAQTIHRMLQLGGGDGQRRQAAPLDADLVVVDEVSMVDIVLMNQLLKAVPSSACLVLVGDVDQLPSIGPGRVLADAIASTAVPVVRLTEIFRQAQESGIVRAAHRVNQGRVPEGSKEPSGDFFFIESSTPEAIRDTLLHLVRERIPDRFKIDAINDIQVLTPMNRSELGARQLNACLQEALNPYQSGPEVRCYGATYRLGDKVMQMENNYQKEVFNGDIGRIAQIDQDNQELVVHFDGRAVAYDFGELDELALAYALTIHKSQGSEYQAVVVPLHTQHYLMLQRNLLYTAITRGKKLVVLLGSRKALAIAVERQESRQRWSALKERLAAP
jgi:exodeoxyribonuclease V alpha subunit